MKNKYFLSNSLSIDATFYTYLTDLMNRLYSDHIGTLVPTVRSPAFTATKPQVKP